MGAKEAEEDAAPHAEHRTKKKTSKEVCFSVLPDKYQPLIEEEEEETPEERRKRKEEKKSKKKEKYKRYRKNVGRALRLSWRCLTLGLQHVTSTYSSPACALSTVVMEVNRTAGRKA